MVELKETDYNSINDIEKFYLFYCKDCGLFGSSQNLIVDATCISGEIRTFCPNCESEKVDSLEDEIKVYNFFVNKINQIKEIIDVKS